MLLREKPFEISVDGIVVRGKIFIAPNLAARAPAVVILHGIPRTKPSPGDPGYAPMARELARLGFLSLFLNFRGCGESEGNFHILGWSEDLQSLIDWLRKEYAPKGIALLGFSGGGAVAIYTAARDKRVSAVVSASSPANFDALGSGGKLDAWMQSFREIGLIRDPDFPASLPAWLNEFEQVKPIDWVDKISPRPVLFIHGEKDEIVPLEHARLLFEKAGEPKELFTVKNAPHRLRLEAAAIAKAKDWLAAWKNTLAK